MNENYKVYMHVFPNGKRYIGLTKQTVEARYGKQGRNYQGQYVYQFIEQFGQDNIQHIIVKDHLTEEEASAMEIELIRKYDSFHNGYNRSPGGETGDSGYSRDIKYYEYKGEVYTIYELAEMNGSGISPHGIQTRIHRGWSVEKTVETPMRSKKFTYEYNGKEYSIKELYDMCECDINYKQFRTRLWSGWTVERALTQPQGVKDQPFGVVEKTIPYKGRLWNTYELSQIHPELELSSANIYDRIICHGQDVERAITKPKKKTNLQFEYNGKYYNSKEIASICVDKTMTYHDVTDRWRAGWSIERIINTPKQKRDNK